MPAPRSNGVAGPLRLGAYNWFQKTIKLNKRPMTWMASYCQLLAQLVFTQAILDEGCAH